MSATMDSGKISRYFGNAPVLHIPGRTFPVQVQYLEDIVESTQFSYVEETSGGGGGGGAKGRVKMSRNQGRGGTMEYDMSEVYVDASSTRSTMDDSGLDPEDYSIQTRRTITRLYREDTQTMDRIRQDLMVDILLWIDRDVEYQKTRGAVLIFLPGVQEITTLRNILISDHRFANSNNYIVRTLHAGLTMDEQSQAFDIPINPNVRKIVLSTNIAETGVTIPDVVFVIDALEVKEVRYNERTRIRSLVKCTVPQSSAEQRRGRAGRVREGYCFRLVTRSTYDGLRPELIPEMLRVPLRRCV